MSRKRLPDEMIVGRSMGILMIDELVVEAEPATPSRTEIMVAPDTHAGSIVRCAESGRWKYDEKLREFFGIEGDPEFATDLKAGNELEDRALPMPLIRAALDEPGQEH